MPVVHSGRAVHGSLLGRYCPGVEQVTQPHIFDCDSIPSRTKLKPPCPAAVALLSAAKREFSGAQRGKM